MKIVTLFVLSLALVPATVVASPPPADPVDAVLLSAATPDSLRARLLALATHAPNPRVTSQALYYRGVSFEHAAMPDSAIACYRRAMAVGRNAAATTAFVDALLRRRAEGDVAEAIAVLEKLQGAEDDAGPQSPHADAARLGWAYVLSGQAKRGIALLEPNESRLAADPTWNYRMARAYLDAGHATRAFGYLASLNTAARGQDAEILSLLQHLEKSMGKNARINELAKQALQKHDDAEIELLGRLGGRRVRLLASDGAYIGGALFADSTAKRPSRAAVVLASVGDELRDYDSLTVALRRSGFAMFLLDPRGSGWSVAPEFSLPDTWEGRQDALAARVARDVRDATRAFARVARIDTMRVLLVAIGAMAPIAVRAAADDPHVSGLVLLDPWTSPVDRGATLAAARRIQAAAYIHLGVSNRGESAFSDTLFHSLPQRMSRIVESTALGSGAAAFGSRPDVTPRFVTWLSETFNAKSSRRATPPPTPQPK